MFFSIDVWKILAGIAFFLLGMNQLEDALKQLAGRPFKLFLKRQTSHKLKAVAGGAVVTALLQSSSVVNLMVLAFVGADVIKMQNALAIILGANFGTTLDSWVIATIGFRFNIESFAFPITGLAGIAMALMNKDNRWYQWSKFFFGFGFLFVGLDYMRTGIEEVVKQIDLISFNQYPAIVFLLLGFFITTLIQSSLATMTIVLSALYVDVISLYAATAIVLGSEIGTSIKLIIASLKGFAPKKRVAIGNFLFNMITAMLVFIMLRPVNSLIVEVLQIKDHLIALVFFQSFVNLLGIIMFFPFLNTIGRYLEGKFKVSEDDTLFIAKIAPDETDSAMDALTKETKRFIFLIIQFSLDTFNVNTIELQNVTYQNYFYLKSYLEKYEYIKHLHGELHSYYIQLQKIVMNQPESEKLNQLISAVRNCMYAAKSMKDAHLDVKQLGNSSNDAKYDFYLQTQQKVEFFSKRLTELLQLEKESIYFEELVSIYQSVQDGYTQTLKEFYQKGLTQHLNEVETSTLVNFNREMYTALKAMVWGIKDYLLDSKQVEYFDNLPGFIR
ncbi:Na/Pi cotransporter family protein [Solitalea lacus]|uniref:Na/Pi cotransporter family protein n=1 Tax=Solitalea lacus TaxID=2911172 RepID=UPI001ED9CF80|nr:Na/Pi symporter [Solitalea lacus]UKJ06696.1 Na/Pi symporter [Solitalea lacus]